MTVTMGTKRKPKHEPAPPEKKPERPRVIFDSSELLRRAIGLRAAKESVARRRPVSASELLNELLESCLAPELRELEEDES